MELDSSEELGLVLEECIPVGSSLEHAQAEQHQAVAVKTPVQTPFGDCAEYELLSIIGEGGMGRVFKARHKQLNKLFAVKLVHPELVANDAAMRRFKLEAKAATDLTHANLVAVYGHGETAKGDPFLVMDLIDGVSLAEVIQKEGFLDVPRALEIFIQISEALAHAHCKGVVHRDLKPSNVLLTNDQEGTEIVKVFDFGIAKILSTGRNIDATATGEVFGSPSYMSPEQCLGQSLDARSDIYSLGCIMYEALTGKVAFDGANVIQTIMRHLNEEVDSLRRTLAIQNVPEGLVAVVVTALNKDPNQRYQSMEELSSDLRRVRDGQMPLDWKPQRKKFRCGKPKMKEILPLSLGLLVIICGALLVGFLQNQHQTALPSISQRISISDSSGRLLYRTVTADGISGALNEAISKGVDLSGADFSGQRIHDISGRYAVLKSCNFSRCRLEDFMLRDCQLQGSNFSGAAFEGCRLEDCNLTEANFTDSNNEISPSDYERSNLTGANFSRASFNGCLFRYCILTKANFRSANLAAANFAFSNLTGADLRHSNLTSADMPSAVFTNANFQGSDVVGIYVPNSVGLNLDGSTEN